MSVGGTGHHAPAGLTGASGPADADGSAFIRLDRVYKVHRMGSAGVAAL